MTGSELVAISRLLKYGSKAVKQLINSNEGKKIISDAKKGAKVVSDSTIKPATKKGKELYSNHITSSQIKKIRKKIDFMMELEGRSAEDEIIMISDDEIEKLITMCNDTTIDDVFLKYLLMIFAVKSRGIMRYVKQISETRTYIDMFFSDIIDESILNEKNVYKIGQAIKAWIPLVINNNLIIWDKYEEEKKQIREEKERIIEEKKKVKEEEIRRKKEKQTVRTESLGSQEILFIIGIIIIIIFLLSL